jgi:hypothetical protein
MLLQKESPSITKVSLGAMSFNRVAISAKAIQGETIRAV